MKEKPRKVALTFCLFFMVIYNSMCHSEVNAAQESRKSDIVTPMVYCIVPLSNNTGDKKYDALAEGFADMLVATFSEQNNIKIVERQKLSELLKEQKLSLLGLTDPTEAVKVGKLLKSDRILIGGITKPKEDLTINIHVYEIESFRLVASEQISSKPAAISHATYNLTNKLCENLSIPLKPMDPNDIDKNPNSSLHFIRGLGFFYTGNYDNAIVEFMKAQELDQTSDKAVYWTALSYINNKEYQHAIIELEAVLKQFPESNLRQDSQEKIALCTQYIAEAKQEEQL